jgi:inorganic triphosphatase YgiF
MAREIELKLEIDPSTADQLRDHPLLTGREPARNSQLSVYFDTRKNKLRAAGFSLRVRRIGDRFIQTIKGGSGAAGLFDRDEWEAPVSGLWPEAAAAEGTPIAALLKPAALRKLVAIVHSEVQRSVWLIDHDDSRIELTLDEGVIRGGETEQPLHEIELELKDGKVAALIAVARLLAQLVPLRIGVLSKSERGFALADGLLAKPAKAGPVTVDRSMSAAEGFAAVFHACIRHFRLNEPLIIAARDATALHQARVAMRRLRAAFSLFRPVLRDVEFEPLREELRWFTAQLGEARNLDVYLQRLDEDHQDRPRLTADREQAYSTIIDTLGSQRFRDLMLSLVAWVELGKWRGRRKAREPLSLVAGRRIDRLWEKIEPGGAQLKQLAEEPRHRLRIDVKKLRYALEFVARLDESGGAGRKRFMGALEELQEELGQLNDMATARQISAGISGEGDSPAAETHSDPTPEEDRHLARSQAAFRRLRKADPFWRQSLLTEPSQAAPD